MIFWVNNSRLSYEIYISYIFTHLYLHFKYKVVKQFLLLYMQL